MMHYKDRTWCPRRYSDRCHRSQGCYRVLTEEDRIAAEKWWGGPNFPICIYSEKPECFVSIPIHTTDGEE